MICPGDSAMNSSTTFISISPTHLAFSLARMKTPLEKVTLVIIFESKMYDISSYHRVLSGFPELAAVHILDYGRMVRQWILRIIQGDMIGGMAGLAATRCEIRNIMGGRGEVLFCGGLINPLVRLILREIAGAGDAGARIWYEDGIGEYRPRIPVSVHPNIEKAGLAFMFNEDYRELPHYTMACFYPDLYPVPGPKIFYTDYFSVRSRFYRERETETEKIFADFGLFNTVLPHAEYMEIIRKSFTEEERRTIHLKLHPSAPQTDKNPLEKLGFIPLTIRDSLEDICTGSTTCYGFASSALYRLPMLTGATTECLPSGVPQWLAYESILKEMGVAFRLPLTEMV